MRLYYAEIKKVVLINIFNFNALLRTNKCAKFATSRSIIAIGVDNKRTAYRMESSPRGIRSQRRAFKAWIMHFTGNIDITLEQKTLESHYRRRENDLLSPISLP